MVNDPLHRQRCWEATKCANCNIEVDKKTLEDDEYNISALCLECQKEFFKDEEAGAGDEY